MRSLLAPVAPWVPTAKFSSHRLLLTLPPPTIIGVAHNLALLPLPATTTTTTTTTRTLFVAAVALRGLVTSRYYTTAPLRTLVARYTEERAPRVPATALAKLGNPGRLQSHWRCGTIQYASRQLAFPFVAVSNIIDSRSIVAYP